MRLMTAYWLLLVVVAAVGMEVGYLCHDRTTYLINAALFLFDVAMLIRQPGA